MLVAFTTSEPRRERPLHSSGLRLFLSFKLWGRILFGGKMGPERVSAQGQREGGCPRARLPPTPAPQPIRAKGLSSPHTPLRGAHFWPLPPPTPRPLVRAFSSPSACTRPFGAHSPQCGQIDAAEAPRAHPPCTCSASQVAAPTQVDGAPWASEAARAPLLVPE